ncbi:MAG: hypothetical protein HY365_01945 [Candidatus Aenigmarchaeota archaeon]|nr:hypothetical protein [Candidatus Aenigmarchaeota archaeon]
MVSRPPEYSLKTIILNGISATIDDRRPADYTTRFRRYMQRARQAGESVRPEHLTTALQELGVPASPNNPILTIIYESFYDAQARISSRRLCETATPAQLQKSRTMRATYGKGSYNGGTDDGRVFIAGDMVHIQPEIDMHGKAAEAMEMPLYTQVSGQELPEGFGSAQLKSLLHMKSMHNNGYIFG